MRMITPVLILLVLLRGVVLARDLPHSFSLPANLKGMEKSSVKAYGEARFRLPGTKDHVQRGKHWSAALRMERVPKTTAGKVLWGQIKPSLLESGWAIAGEYDENPFSATVHRPGTPEGWASFMLFSPLDIRVALVEVSGSKLALKLPPPGDTIETVSPGSGDFPYLPPLPGATFAEGSLEARPMEIRLPGNKEVQVVGTATLVKNYRTPRTISNLEFATVYHDAFTAAGWNILAESHGLDMSDATLTARYVKNGRDIWAYLHYQSGHESIQVADAGRIDIKQALKDDCHIALYGVLFEFNESTLRPESDAPLLRARDALKDNPTLAIEVQGHTDAIGTDAYNRKLSESRAQSVMHWLVKHGIPGSQLTAKGYGETRPVDKNDSESGRARNRRVELACRKS